jgi:hypothetical protein
MRDIIRRLHQGLSVEEARERFEREVGGVSSTEIAEIEQSLIDEGMSPEEIKKFCNVHTLLFQSSLEESVVREESPVHPVTLFRKENREIEKLAGRHPRIWSGSGRTSRSGRTGPRGSYPSWRSPASPGRGASPCPRGSCPRGSCPRGSRCAC